MRNKLEFVHLAALVMAIRRFGQQFICENVPDRRLWLVPLSQDFWSSLDFSLWFCAGYCNKEHPCRR
jgi:hypothetical protein